MRRIFILLIAILWVSLDCKSGNKKEVLVVDSDAIIYFTLSKGEYGNLQEKETLEANEVLNDHYPYFQRIKKYFIDKNIKVLLKADKKMIF